MPRSTLLKENFRISLQAIKANKLRSVLTIFIIAFGIMALVGILTAIDSIRYSLNEQFAVMGANSFSISSRKLFVSRGGQQDEKPRITYREAEEFKKQFEFPARVSLRIQASGTATVKYKSEKTNPNIDVVGTDDQYLFISGYNMAQGRNFSSNEITANAHVVIIGSNLATKLFKHQETPLGNIITIGAGKYKVIGILEEKGSGFGGGGDDICILPVTNVRQYFSRPGMDYTITVLPNDSKLTDVAISEATGLFRVIRDLRPGEETNFVIESSDNLANLLMENLKYVTIAALVQL